MDLVIHVQAMELTDQAPLSIRFYIPPTITMLLPVIDAVVMLPASVLEMSY